jgi:hypothetical protein
MEIVHKVGKTPELHNPVLCSATPSFVQTQRRRRTTVARLPGPPIGLRYGRIFNPYLCRARLSESAALVASASTA